MGVADMPEYPGLLPTISKPLLDRKRFSEKLECLRMIAEALERDAAMYRASARLGLASTVSESRTALSSQESDSRNAPCCKYTRPIAVNM